MGFADLEIGDGQVWMRRLHLRADDTQRLDKLLIHELTHVVLADHFAKHQIPRWADEGIAVLSEPVERRNELRLWLSTEASQGRLWSLRDLANLRQLPGDQRLGELFYAQSAGLIEYLLTEKKLTESQLLEFVVDSQKHGLPRTVTRWFSGLSIETLDAEWRSWGSSGPGQTVVPVAWRGKE
jgi:hypothetical protein